MNKNSKILYLVSLGCPKNFVDTEVMAGTLISNGWGLTFDPNEADIFMINTCAFIPPARNEARETIEEAVLWKQQAPRRRKVIVTGCLVQRGRLESLRGEYPEVDLWTGIDQIPEIAAILEQQAKNNFKDKHFLCNVAPNFIYDDQSPRLQLTLPHLAYVKITEGCDNRCSYCSIPSIRGGLRSRTTDSVMQEADNLLQSGVLELLLIGQDITAFGQENGSGENLAELLRKLDGFGGDYWLRLLYTHPAHFTDELIEALAKSKHALPYLDIPLQHISDNILTAMGRKISRRNIEQLLKKLRAAIPGLALRTTFITGFPGETEDNFAQLKDFVIEQQFERLGVFSYYPEPGTPAAEFSNQIAAELAEQRASELLETQAKLAEQHNQSLIGQTFKVIVDMIKDDVGIGRSYMDAPEIDNNIIFPIASGLQPGEFKLARVVAADIYDLTAEIVG